MNYIFKSINQSSMFIPFSFQLTRVNSSLSNLRCHISAKLMHRNSISLKTSNRVQQVAQLMILKTIMQLLVNISQVCDVKLPLTMPVQQVKMSLSSLLSKWVTDLLCQLRHETLKVQSVTLIRIVNLLNQSEDEFILLVKSQCLGGYQNILHLCSSLSGISIE